MPQISIVLSKNLAPFLNHSVCYAVTINIRSAVYAEANTFQWFQQEYDMLVLSVDLKTTGCFSSRAFPMDRC